MSRIVIAAAVVVAALFGAASAQTNCAGAGYDLSSLANSEIVVSDGTWTWHLHPCGASIDTTCATKNTAGTGSFCQYRPTDPSTAYHLIAAWDSTGTYTACDATTCPNGGVVVQFANGDGCTNNNNQPRTTKIIVKCDPTVTEPPTTYTVATEGTTGAASCAYDLTFSHASGCPGSGNGGSPSKKLSGGSIFLIILVVVIPVYIIVGCAYKYKAQGTRGMESCPNVDFWRSLPGLVKDGFAFTIAKLRGCCGGSGGDGSYENVK